MNKLTQFKNHRVMKIKKRNVNYMGVDSFILNYFYAKRAIMNDYKYAMVDGDIFEISINNPIHGGIPIDPKKCIKEQKMISVWLNKKVA